MDITPETVKNIKSRGFVKCAITPNVYVINGKLDVHGIYIKHNIGNRKEIVDM